MKKMPSKTKVLGWVLVLLFEILWGYCLNEYIRFSLKMVQCIKQSLRHKQTRRLTLSRPAALFAFSECYVTTSALFMSLGIIRHPLG